MNTLKSCSNQQRQKIIPYSSVVSQMLYYADLCCRRGYVSNSLGNICLRVEDKQFPDEAVCYTKHRGVSLEEMQFSHVVITNIKNGQLLYGSIEPSIGHQLNRKIFSERKDVSAVLHLHANSVIAYFSATRNTKLPFISVDTPLILEKPVFVLGPDENVEVVPDSIPDFIHDTNCFVMPYHGITSVGQTLSQAYHRLNSVVAEIDRLITSMAICTKDQSELIYRSDVDVNNLFAEGRKIVYGEYEPTYEGFSHL